MFNRAARLILATPLLLALGSAGAWAGSSDGNDSFTFPLETPPLDLRTQDDGFVELRLQGFRTHGAAVGAPDVPTRTVLVAIPPGSTPRLSVNLTGARTFREALPRPIPHLLSETEAGSPRKERGQTGRPDLVPRALSRVYRPSARHYDGEGTTPEQVAWLGRTGVLRDQRYVEVHLAPVRFDRASGGLVVEHEMEVTVHFDGAVVSSVDSSRRDRFESVYREAFVNYSQGRRFRVSAVGDEVAPLPKQARSTEASGGPIRRIRVRSEGMLRLDHALFSASAPEFLGTDPRNWRLTNRGEQVPLQIRQEAGDLEPDVLEPGEWVQFYGQPLDDEPLTMLDYDPLNPAERLWEILDFTDENVYFLSVDVTAQPTMTEREAAPYVGTAEPHFPAVAREEVDDLFLPLADAPWFWEPFTNEGSGERREEIKLTGLVDPTLPARVRLQLRGFIDCLDLDPDKRTFVWLENSGGQTLVLPASNPDNVGNQNVGEHDGDELFVHDFDWTHSGGDPVLTDPIDVLLDADDLTGTCTTDGAQLLNENLLDYIEVEYRRAFTTLTDSLIFDYPDGDALFEITGFASDAVEVYEVTGRIGSSGVADAVRLTGVGVDLDGANYTVKFRMNDAGLDEGTLRRFVVTGHASTSTPAPGDFEADRVSALISDTTQADLVVIAHPDLVPSVCSEGGNACTYDVDCDDSPTDRCEPALGGALDDLLGQRAGQGIAARVARIGDIEDEFNHGLSGPGAIGAFLEWVLSGGWSGEPPAYAMLVGDGSFDYKGGPAVGNFIPTRMMIKTSDILAHYSSDNMLGAVVGEDYLADVVMGRITARTADETTDILTKIFDYQDDPVAGSWNSSVLFVSDRGKNWSAPEALGFESLNDIGDNFLGGTSYSSTKLRYWSDNCGGVPGLCDPAVMKQDIKDEINAGVVMAQFAGHGNFILWSDDVFFCVDESFNHERCDADDTADLTNAGRLPFLIVHNCLTGGFHTPKEKSFGEQWLKKLLGGAYAVYAPSGLGYRFIGEDVTESIWGDVFGPTKERMLGVPIINSQVMLCGSGRIEACQYYTLMGDPSTKLGLPDVRPAANLVATASTGVDAYVDLSWDPSETLDAKYNVYRSTDQLLLYTKVNPSPIDATEFRDSGVVHTGTYIYYVVAEDQGFESAWSNFNSDCGAVPGPDCVQATPLNLDPPAIPGGLAVSDAESGGRLHVSWIESPEVDVEWYTLHYGPTTGLGQTMEVYVSETDADITGLDNGTPYFVAIQARNTSGTESSISSPETGTPTLVLGVKAPDRITDLRLAKSGNDAVLSWSAVTQDIYGKPKSVSHYEVYRGATAEFVPSPAELLSPQPAVSTFTDSGSLVGSEPHFYLVRGVDGAGNPGGLGGQLPQGIMDLSLEPSEATPGAIVLSWSPVTTDFDGNPSAITHYEVYGANAPFSRNDIESGGVGLVAPLVGGSSTEILPAGDERYYSVLAVDVRGNRSPF